MFVSELVEIITIFQQENRKQAELAQIHYISQTVMSSVWKRFYKRQTVLT